MEMAFNLSEYSQVSIIQGAGELGCLGDQGAQWEQKCDSIHFCFR